MVLSELLNRAKQRYLTEARAGLARNGVPQGEIEKAIEGTDTLLTDYNEMLLSVFGASINVVRASIPGNHEA